MLSKYLCEWFGFENASIFWPFFSPEGNYDVKIQKFHTKISEDHIDKEKQKNNNHSAKNIEIGVIRMTKAGHILYYLPNILTLVALEMTFHILN